MTNLCGTVTENMDEMVAYANKIELRTSKNHILKFQNIKSKHLLNLKDIVYISAQNIIFNISNVTQIKNTWCAGSRQSGYPSS